jgi:hypothetical protein
MNLAGDGLMLLVALHELADRERAYLSAPPGNGVTSRAFLAPPPQPNPRRPAACLFFARSTSIDSSAFGRGWLTHKRAEDQNHRPARRPFSGCLHRAGLLPTRSVAPRRLADADETRTRQVVEALTHFGKARGEISTAQHETGLRPVDAPFHETSVTGLRPVGQDCSAATLGPSATAAPSSNAPSTHPATLCPFPLPSTATSSLSARLQLGGAHLVFTARACRRCHQRGGLRRAPRQPEPTARAANRPQLHSPRGPSRLPYPSRPSSTFPPMPSLFPLDKLPRRRDHRFTNTPRGTHGGAHHVIVGRARSTGCASWHRPLSLPANSDRRFGYLPTRACTRPALRAGG